MSVLLKGTAPRRTLLRGLLNGAAVSVALPFLDCFLNENGTALASGAPLPVRFGTWFWGLGHQPGTGFEMTGPEIKLLATTKPLEPVKKYMNAFSGFNAALDGTANLVHYSGLIVARSGAPPKASGEIPAPTFDVMIADAIGSGTRFRSLDVSTAGARVGFSARNTASKNTADTSPLAFYLRVFGPDFADPNKADFVPDPKVMVRQSVLSTVNDQTKRFAQRLGATDKARVDEYFTSIRELENQLAMQLEKPAPNEACRIPASPAEGEMGTDIENVTVNHKTLVQILAMAVACNQTKIFNVTLSSAASGLRRAGDSHIHHQLSHEEPVDPKLGYQLATFDFDRRSMECLTTCVQTFAAIREGDGTLLDRMLMMAHSDTNNARVHALDGIPVMFFGTAGGKLKTGVHNVGNGDPITRIGLTAMQIMGLRLDSWGVGTNMVNKPVSAILA